MPISNTDSQADILCESISNVDHEKLKEKNIIIPSSITDIIPFSNAKMDFFKKNFTTLEYDNFKLPVRAAWFQGGKIYFVAQGEGKEEEAMYKYFTPNPLVPQASERGNKAILAQVENLVFFSLDFNGKKPLTLATNSISDFDAIDGLLWVPKPSRDTWIPVLNSTRYPFIYISEKHEIKQYRHAAILGGPATLDILPSTKIKRALAITNNLEENWLHFITESEDEKNVADYYILTIKNLNNPRSEKRTCELSSRLSIPNQLEGPIKNIEFYKILNQSGMLLYYHTEKSVGFTTINISGFERGLAPKIIDSTNIFNVWFPNISYVTLDVADIKNKSLHWFAVGGENKVVGGQLHLSNGKINANNLKTFTICPDSFISKPLKEYYNAITMLDKTDPLTPSSSTQESTTVWSFDKTTQSIELFNASQGLNDTECTTNFLVPKSFLQIQGYGGRDLSYYFPAVKTCGTINQSIGNNNIPNNLQGSFLILLVVFLSSILTIFLSFNGCFSYFYRNLPWFKSNTVLPPRRNINSMESTYIPMEEIPHLENNINEINENLTPGDVRDIAWSAESKDSSSAVTSYIVTNEENFPNPLLPVSKSNYENKTVSQNSRRKIKFSSFKNSNFVLPSSSVSLANDSNETLLTTVSKEANVSLVPS